LEGRLMAGFGDVKRAEQAQSTATEVSGLSGLDIDKAVTYLDEKASDSPQYHCARAVRLAIEAGGIHLKSPPIAAKDYGSTLEQARFTKINLNGYREKKGDIAVIQNYKGGSKEGHICMYDGKVWVSDFRQNDMWSGPGYRKNRPPYVIYRP
jgi:type VI secretion system secreted protein VgrG